MPAGIKARLPTIISIWAEKLSGKNCLVTWWRSEDDCIRNNKYFSRRIDRGGWGSSPETKTPRISRCSCNQRIIKINLPSKQFNISKYICEIAHQSPKYSSYLIYFNFPCLVFLRRGGIRGWRQLICLSLLSTMGQYPLRFVHGLCCSREFFSCLTHTKDNQL